MIILLHKACTKMTDAVVAWSELGRPMHSDWWGLSNITYWPCLIACRLRRAFVTWEYAVKKGVEANLEEKLCTEKHSFLSPKQTLQLRRQFLSIQSTCPSSRHFCSLASEEQLAAKSSHPQLSHDFRQVNSIHVGYSWQAPSFASCEHEASLSSHSRPSIQL